ncbi:hypothetical protein [Niabella hibiscisoli]|uniref:hypothetical protein n=1 Tax=Niabella hibiscisoli TaxID=1825928 RepID=UPI001F0D33D0|nr:hypothetical protein [Niabella hibiscisoli]MCH5714729.1 hypothetical protein [Niabella hibiscisoli]
MIKFPEPTGAEGLAIGFQMATYSVNGIFNTYYVAKMTSLLLWLLIFYTSLGLLQLFIYSQKSRSVGLYQRLLFTILFITTEILAAGYASSLFFDLIRGRGLRCATGAVALWGLAFGAVVFGLTLLNRKVTNRVAA